MEGLVDHVAVAALWATLLSLLLSWFPGLNTWWEEKFNPAQKQGLMAGAVALISISVVGVNCARGIVCPEDWWSFITQVLVVIIIGYGAQQGVHFGTKYLK